jgi:pilus assembly protein Flp/PilA
MQLLKNHQRRKAQGLVEYALLIAGVALIAAAAVAIFGHKVTDMIAATAAVLPGAHVDDNGTITSGKIIETTPAGTVGGGPGTGASLDVNTIGQNSGKDRLGINVLGNNTVGQTNGFDGLVVEAQ